MYSINAICNTFTFPCPLLSLQQLQQYIREGKLHLDANDVLQPSEEFDVPAPDPPSSLNHEESACAHYLHSEHELVSLEWFVYR